MTAAEIGIRRPVLTIVIALLIVIAGIIGLTQLGVREYPAVDPPTLSINTSYVGAAAEVVQAQITEPIEEAINTVAGIRTLTSTSREGVSQVSAEFSLDTDLDAAASDVRDQVARAVRNLPPDVNPPVLNKAHADSSPIFGIALRSERRSQLELGAYANALRERLQTVPGIASVDQPAEKRYAMRLWMDPEKIAAYNLSPVDIRRALQRESIELPSGRIEGESIELPVKTFSRLNTPAEFNALVIKRGPEGIVRFRDVGYAELGPQNERGALKMGEFPIAGLYFRPQPGANQIEIVDELHRRLDRVRRELPEDIQMEIAFDNTQYVRRSLREVTETLGIAFVLVVLVVFAFFREWRTTLIPVLAIPVSIVGGFAVMAAAGFSINTLTLLGMVLAIGLVVDDAIVVLENIYAKVEQGMPPIEAAIAGLREIFLAILATTASLVVVFLPLLFMGGLSGRLFREFGVTIAGAVVISAIVALTLAPMVSSRLLRRRERHGWLMRTTEPFFQAIEAGYGRLLDGFLRWRWLGLAVLVGAAFAIHTVFQVLPRELSPLEDRGRIWVRATAPEGVSYDYMQNYMDDVAKAVMERVPEAPVTMTQVPGSGGGPGIQGAINTGFVRLFLTDKETRSRSQQEIAADLQGLGAEFTGARLNITQEASIGERRSTQSGVQFVIQATGLEPLREVLPAFLEAARRSPVFTFVDADLRFSKPEVQVRIERDKAQMLGVSALDIAEALQAALSGQRFGYFIHEGKQYDVIGQFTRDYRSRPRDLGTIVVPTADGSSVVRLDNLVTLEESSAPPELYRYNRYSAATVAGTLAHGRTMGEGIAVFEEVARATLDDRFTTSLTGGARDFVESSSSLGWVFLLALILIYLVLAAQFESFLDPFVILLTVPLAIAGALLGLWMFGQSLNIFSQIGLIMLIGLVAKNGILIVEFANQRRDAGAPSALVAAHQAATARLRPILMTTLSTILGILPIALAIGAGSESRVSMGIAVIGGLISGGALTLFVIPAMYSFLSRRKAAISGPALEPVAVASESGRMGSSVPAAT
ncbi:MAG: efflux RND transporter permease subunit [Verrucomicrobiae bacterium]|nr:efflux RND transporter permease subunit [Verrucomicrobiae bacterium]